MVPAARVLWVPAGILRPRAARELRRTILPTSRPLFLRRRRTPTPLGFLNRLTCHPVPCTARGCPCERLWPGLGRPARAPPNPDCREQIRDHLRIHAPVARQRPPRLAW